MQRSLRLLVEQNQELVQTLQRQVMECVSKNRITQSGENVTLRAQRPALCASQQEQLQIKRKDSFDQFCTHSANQPNSKLNSDKMGFKKKLNEQLTAEFKTKKTARVNLTSCALEL